MSKATQKPEKELGPHDLAKDNSSTASRRDNHPAKQKDPAKHEALRQDQRVSGFDTKSVGKGSFPKKSTGAKEVKR